MTDSCTGKPSFTKGRHELNETLLLDWGIAYIVVSAEKLPTVVSMRSSFLGEMELDPVEDQVTRGADSEFYADMHAFAKMQSR